MDDDELAARIEATKPGDIIQTGPNSPAPGLLMTVRELKLWGVIADLRERDIEAAKVMTLGVQIRWSDVLPTGGRQVFDPDPYQSMGKYDPPLPPR